MMSNKNVSILFTGQGSQYPDMGIDLTKKYSWAMERYNISSDILGYNVLEAQKKPELINLTEYSQPMIFILSSILIDICRDYIIQNSSKIILAGHSLGEYSALYFAKAAKFEEMLKIVKSRGESMSIVSDPKKYAMYALIKKEDQKIDYNLFGNGVYIANFNSDKQLVLCGLKKNLDEFKEKNHLGKYIPLNVSAPFHSELMIESSKLFLEKNKSVKFNNINFDILSNHKLINYLDIKDNEYINQLSKQIYSPVMWSDTIKKIVNFGVGTFIEIGPKKTLLNFVEREFEGKKISITNTSDILNYVQ